MYTFVNQLLVSDGHLLSNVSSYYEGQAMRKTFKYRLFPTASQARRLKEALEHCRWVYNETLAVRKQAWEQHQLTLDWLDTKAMLPGWKQAKPELKRVHARASRL